MGKHLYRIIKTLNGIWYRYKEFAKDATQAENDAAIKDITYWQQKLFTTFTIYFTPISLMALIPGVTMAIKDKVYVIAVFDILAAIVINTTIFNKKVNIAAKKATVIAVLYLLALCLIVTLGLFGPGIIYLLTITVFTTVVFPGKAGYWSVMLHFVTCCCFGLSISLKLFNSPLFGAYTLGTWVAVSSNLIFLSLVIVVLIKTILNGLEGTITSEYQLRHTLKAEAIEKTALNEQLSDSVGHYKSLFYLNPSPMWVFDKVTFKILQVNAAAINNYGYTAQEFLNMTVSDIRGEKERENLAEVFSGRFRSDEAYQFTTIHRGKHRQPFPVEIRYNSIPFRGTSAVLAIVRDISEHVKNIAAKENQNLKLREIAFIQSHIVRAPLARIIGLVDLLIQTSKDESRDEMFHYLHISTQELDDIIRSIIEKTENIEYSESTFRHN